MLSRYDTRIASMTDSEIDMRTHRIYSVYRAFVCKLFPLYTWWMSSLVNMMRMRSCCRHSLPVRFSSTALLAARTVVGHLLLATTYTTPPLTFSFQHFHRCVCRPVTGETGKSNDGKLNLLQWTRKWTSSCHRKLVKWHLELSYLYGLLLKSGPHKWQCSSGGSIIVDDQSRQKSYGRVYTQLHILRLSCIPQFMHICFTAL